MGGWVGSPSLVRIKFKKKIVPGRFLVTFGHMNTLQVQKPNENQSKAKSMFIAKLGPAKPVFYFIQALHLYLKPLTKLTISSVHCIFSSACNAVKLVC